MAMREDRKPHNHRRPPLDAAMLEAHALRYVERFQTTRARLRRFLEAKVRTRGWEGDGPPAIAELAERLAARGYIDEAAFADARTRSMKARGLGSRRVVRQLRADGIAEPEAEPDDGEEAHAAALAWARRKRLGPFGAPPADRREAMRQMAAMLRAGHAPAVARAVLGAGADDLHHPDDPPG